MITFLFIILFFRKIKIYNENSTEFFKKFLTSKSKDEMEYFLSLHNEWESKIYTRLIWLVPGLALTTSLDLLVIVGVGEFLK